MYIFSQALYTEATFQNVEVVEFLDVSEISENEQRFYKSHRLRNPFFNKRGTWDCLQKSRYRQRRGS